MRAWGGENLEWENLGGKNLEGENLGGAVRTWRVRIWGKAI